MKIIFSTFRKCYKYLEQYKYMFWFNILLKVVLQAMKLLEPWALAFMIEGLYNINGHIFIWSLVGLAGCLVVSSMISYACKRIEIKIQKHVNIRVKQNLMYGFIKSRPTSLQNFSDGRLLNTMLEDSMSLCSYLYSLCSYIIDIINILAISIMIIMIEPVIFICIIFYYPAIYFINNRFAKRIHRKNVYLLAKTDIITGHLKNYLHNLNDIKSSAAFKKIMKKYIEETDDIMSSTIDCEREKLTASTISSNIGIAGNLLFFLTGGLMVLAGRISATLFVSYASYAQRLSGSMYTMTTMITSLQQQIVRVNRFLEIDITCAESIRREAEKECLDNVKSDIGMQDVSLSLNGKEILKNIQLCIPFGKTAAFVGINGSGKTSILNLIAGIYEPVAGMVKIGGKDIRHIQYESIVRHICYVKQEAAIYPMTVLENLLISDDTDVSIERVIEICKLTGIYEDIMQMPLQFQTVLSDNYSLSTGQRKKMQLARSFLRNTPIIILDEPMANLDEESKRIIYDILKSYKQEHTILIATHQKEAFELFDRMINVEEINFK